MVTIEDVRAFASGLPRAYEVLVRDRVKFRVGRIVFLAFSRDETQMGFGFPRELREALVASDPEKFLMPGKADLRYQWVEANSYSTPGGCACRRRSPPDTRRSTAFPAGLPEPPGHPPLGARSIPRTGAFDLGQAPRLVGRLPNGPGRGAISMDERGAVIRRGPSGSVCPAPAPREGR
jgi:hypothetical protein